MFRKCLTLAGAAGILAGPALAADLDIEVRGVRSEEGYVAVAVHTPATSDTFPGGDCSFACLKRIAGNDPVRFVLKDVPAGRYAVAVYHDENANGDLDTNVLGSPTEGFGFANDASAFFGPPDFDAAAVAVGSAPISVAVHLTYWSGND